LNPRFSHLSLFHIAIYFGFVQAGLMGLKAGNLRDGSNPPAVSYSTYCFKSIAMR